MNILVRYNKIHKYESVWRDSKKITEDDYDYRGVPFPFPTQKKESKTFKKIMKKFLNKLEAIENHLDEYEQYKRYSKSKPDLISGRTNVTKKLYNLFNVHWEDSLSYYITNYNIKPSKEFMKFINRVYIDKEDNFQLSRPGKKKDIIIKIPSTIFHVGKKKYIHFTKNQLMIMDALMKDGGYQKRYFDSKGELRYSEHSGLIDFNNGGFERIIVNAAKNISDTGDHTILLPKNMIETYDYEYLFHTHPPTPKPGGRAKSGFLYEFPSISDIFHFIEHYNNGVTQGSIVIAPEGIYVIRTYKLDLNKQVLIHDEDEVWDLLQKTKYGLQKKAIKKYGTNFSIEFFYSNIAQDTHYIKQFNKVLKNYHLNIYYKPRVKHGKRWILNNVYLPVNPIEPVVHN